MEKKKEENPKPKPRKRRIRTSKWHPVRRRERSLNTKYAEAMEEDLHLSDFKVSEAELNLMRRIAFS